METDFWHHRWHTAQIGFHLNEVNPYLVQYWPQLDVPKGSRVLVPLCGKSVDLLWLAQQGYEVVGVELSPLAVAAFFAEQGLVADKKMTKTHEVWQNGAITLFCGDFFDLRPEDIGLIEAVYDRAALIALPETMRQGYIRHLMMLCPAPVKSLLVTLFYEQSRMDGPPFAVSPEEVQNLLSDYFEVRLAAQLNILEQNPRFKEKGLKWFEEHIYLLRSRN